MKKATEQNTYYFVDESGDPIFYDKYGRNLVALGKSSRVLLIGFIECSRPREVRRKLAELIEKIKHDEYLQSFPSWKKSIIAFHAKDDIPEIRERVFKLIKQLDFKTQIIVARKNEDLFKKKFNANPDNFYFDLVSKAFQNRLHLHSKITIYFAKRGNQTQQKRFEEAIENATANFQKKWGKQNHNVIRIFPQMPSDEPCLQVIDYVNWAVQRAFVKGEIRYYEFLKEKFSMIWDVYDFKNYKRKGGGVIYTKTNAFDIEKISPL